MPRFAFLVHALTGFHRRAVGVRSLRPGLALGRRDGTALGDVTEICRVGLRGVAEGVVVNVPLTPEQMLADQERALSRMMRAAALAGPVGAIGLGSLCAVVAGRGEALAAQVSSPVTTGGAATAWALWQNTRRVLAVRPGPVGIVGSSGAVGGAVAALLAEDGVALRLDHPRAARGVPGATAFAGPAEAVEGCEIIVGAGPTGATLPAEAVKPGAVIIDVALPATARGRLPRGVRVLAGEAVCLPAGWDRDGWGWLYHVLAGYGPTQVFACVIEPLVLAAIGRDRPFALGRKIEIEAIRTFATAAEGFGFKPRLARGWVEVAPERLALAAPRALIG